MGGVAFPSSLLAVCVFCVLVAQSCPSCPTLCDPMDCTAHQALLSMGFSRQGYWSGLPLPSPGDLPNPGIELGSPALQANALPSELLGKPELVVWPEATQPRCSGCSVAQSVWLFATSWTAARQDSLSFTPWTAAHQASLSFTISWSLLRLMSIESVTPSNHLVLYSPLLLLPSIFPSIRVFSNESSQQVAKVLVLQP